MWIFVTEAFHTSKGIQNISRAHAQCLCIFSYEQFAELFFFSLTALALKNENSFVKFTILLPFFFCKIETLKRPWDVFLSEETQRNFHSNCFKLERISITTIHRRQFGATHKPTIRRLWTGYSFTFTKTCINHMNVSCIRCHWQRKQKMIILKENVSSIEHIKIFNEKKNSITKHGWLIDLLFRFL